MKMIQFSTSVSTGKETIMENVNLVVAENLKNIRISRGWSQKFVADQLGIAQRTVSRAETGIMVSKRILKMLCSLYQVSLSSIYNEYEQEVPKGRQIVPDDVATALLIKTSFVESFEQEVILRYTDAIQKEALMMREDIEMKLAEVISNKKTYSFSDVVGCCMVINQETIRNIRNMAIT